MTFVTIVTLMSCQPWDEPIEVCDLFLHRKGGALSTRWEPRGIGFLSRVSEGAHSTRVGIWHGPRRRETEIQEVESAHVQGEQSQYGICVDLSSSYWPWACRTVVELLNPLAGVGGKCRGSDLN